MATKVNNSQRSTNKTTLKVVGAASSDNAAPATGKAAELIASVPEGKGTRVRPNIFAKQAMEMTQATRDKMAVMGDVRQSLEHARQLYSEGDGKAAEATEIADKSAVRLYQARATGLLNSDEISATLGDIFGYKPKSDGKPGKTPAGQGEAIRKRVVRAVLASEYVNDGDGGSFFAGLPTTEVQDVLAAINDGNLSIWTAYDRFAEIKRDHMVRVNPAFDPKRVAAMVEALSEDGAAAVLAGSPALVAAYGALIEVLNVIGEAAAEEAA